MPKELPASFFDDLEEWTPVANRSYPGLDRVWKYLAERSEAFQVMTSGKNKPMIYGAQSKSKRDG